MFPSFTLTIIQRRNFVKNSLFAGATVLGGQSWPGFPALSVKAINNWLPFKTKFSPEFGIFKGLAPTDPVDEIK